VQPPEITHTQRAALIGTVQAARDAGLTAEVAGQASVPPTEVGGAAELVGVAAALIVLPIASALALGILVDAVVVRMVIMPSALALLVARAWWLPRWLAWLPRVDVEGLALDRPAPEPEREPVSR
jgi:putative drug exporter of the RND superfamily